MNDRTPEQKLALHAKLEEIIGKSIQESYDKAFKNWKTSSISSVSSEYPKGLVGESKPKEIAIQCPHCGQSMPSASG